jgi:hypothetical protein
MTTVLPGAAALTAAWMLWPGRTTEECALAVAVVAPRIKPATAPMVTTPRMTLILLPS